MNDWFVGVMCCVMLLASYAFGYVVGSSTIATECLRMGSFYVGQTVFECKDKNEPR